MGTMIDEEDWRSTRLEEAIQHEEEANEARGDGLQW